MVTKRTSDLLTTKGIGSTVFEDGEEIGHVMMVDYDGKGTTDTLLEEEVGGEPGLNLLLESSPGSYHYYNLTVDSAPVRALEMLAKHGDAKHVQIGWRKRKWVLRCHAKVRQNGDEYKSEPDLEKVWYNDTDKPQSLGHWRFFRAFFDIPDVPWSPNFVGDAYDVDEYVTLTDELKAEIKAEAAKHGQ